MCRVETKFVTLWQQYLFPSDKNSHRRRTENRGLELASQVNAPLTTALSLYENKRLHCCRILGIQSDDCVQCCDVVDFYRTTRRCNP
jgi:hypothetical protein